MAQELESSPAKTYLTEDADVLLVGYGIVSRVLRSTVDQLRAQGLKAGLFRPITLWPFPSRELRENAENAQSRVHGGGTQHRHDGGRRQARRSTARCRWSSTAARAATCPRRKRSPRKSLRACQPSSGSPRRHFGRWKEDL